MNCPNCNYDLSKYADLFFYLENNDKPIICSNCNSKLKLFYEEWLDEESEEELTCFSVEIIE